MLEVTLTKKIAGVEIWRDSYSLRAAHEMIHRVNQDSPVIQNKEGFLLGLAYDLRKAYEAQRQRQRRWRGEGKERCSIYGVQILWPVLIPQVGLLHEAIAFIPTTRRDQAIVYELEALIEEAVRSALPGQEALILAQMQSIGAEHHLIEDLVDSRCRYFIGLPPAQRLKQLPALLDTFDSSYEFLADRVEGASDSLISPDEFDEAASGGWPEFEW
jgi:hypothetical protein